MLRFKLNQFNLNLDAVCEVGKLKLTLVVN